MTMPFPKDWEFFRSPSVFGRIRAFRTNVRSFEHREQRRTGTPIWCPFRTQGYRLLVAFGSATFVARTVQVFPRRAKKGSALVDQLADDVGGRGIRRRPVVGELTKRERAI